MHTLIRDILAVGIGGFTAANAVSNVAEGVIAPLPELREISVKPPDSPRAVLSVGALARGLGLEDIPPAQPPPPLDAVLLGTLVANVEGWSIALVDAGRPRSVRVGDKIGAYQVDEIELRHVWVSANGRRLELGTTRSPGAPRTPPIQLAELARGVFVIPTSKGLLFSRVAPDAPLAAYGLQQGDEVRTINGVGLTSIEAMMSLAGTLAMVRDFEVEIWRNGALIRRSLRL